jgi:hypothetical protein
LLDRAAGFLDKGAFLKFSGVDNHGFVAHYIPCVREASDVAESLFVRAPIFCEIHPFDDEPLAVCSDEKENAAKAHSFAQKAAKAHSFAQKAAKAHSLPQFSAFCLFAFFCFFGDV